MTFQPILPVGGYAGWAFLNRTRETQQAAFDGSAGIAGDVAYFTENIGGITRAEDLVADRRLLRVALEAFGLGEDINNRYFMQKVLDDGTLRDDALANRLSDKRYLAFSKAFGFGDFDPPRTVLSDFPAEITDAFRRKAFEAAVGEQDPDMRLALELDAALAALATRDTSEDGRWYRVMGDPPVRAVFQTALGLPASVGSLDLDQQLRIFRDRTEARFGDAEVAQFADPARREDLVRLFLLQSELRGGSGPALAGSGALTLLQAANGGGAASLLSILS